MATNTPGDNNNFVWRIGNLQVNAQGQLPDDIRTAVQQLLPSGRLYVYSYCVILEISYSLDRLCSFVL